MTTAIKKYEKLTMIYLKDGDALRTTLSPEQVSQELNSKEFLVIDGVGFNRYEVKTFREYEPSDIEQYILSQDKLVRDRMLEIVESRKADGNKTNWVEHLLRIYTDRYDKTPASEAV